MSTSLEEDFGPIKFSTELNGEMIKGLEGYEILKSLTIDIRKNEHGFTTTCDEFDAIFGYGDDVEESINMWKQVFQDLWEHFTRETEDKTTNGYKKLKAKFKEYMERVSI